MKFRLFLASLFAAMSMIGSAAYATPSLFPTTPTYHATNNDFARVTGSAFTLPPGLYALRVYITGSWTGNIAGTLSLINSSNQIVATASNFFNTGTASRLGPSTLYQVLAGDTFTLRLSVDGVGTGSLDFSPQMATVPGPEAGAGLAGLAMAGIGAYALRRRKQSAT